MKMEIKTPLNIIQELIAIHTTRIEMVERFGKKELPPDIKASLKAARQQSEKYTGELMNELSNFGDAVMGNVDNQNEYQAMYKNVLGKIDVMNSKEARDTFQSLENALRKIYNTILKTQMDLPASLKDMLSNQAHGIQER